MTEEITRLAPEIWAAIQKADSILLHCHPRPDGDSVGSALAMHAALKEIGKKSTVIWGDSLPDQNLSVLPGFAEVLSKNIFEIDLSSFDLFIILDSAALSRVSELGPIAFPDTLATAVIDHHSSNQGFAKINLIDPRSPATCAILYQLFKIWNIPITSDIASCLFVGIYTDTGGFLYAGVNKDTFLIAADLADKAPHFPSILSALFTNKKEKLLLQGLVLNSIKTFFTDRVAISSVSHQALMQAGISKQDLANGGLSGLIASVRNWVVGATAFEEEPGITKVSFRTRDPKKWDVSKIAIRLGGGGHIAAAGALIQLPSSEAQIKILEAIKETYPELGEW